MAVKKKEEKPKTEPAAAAPSAPAPEAKTKPSEAKIKAEKARAKTRRAREEGGKWGKALPRRKGEFAYRGVPLEELKKMPIEKVAELLPSRQRRKILRGFTQGEKKLLQGLKLGDSAKTQLREMIVLPEMIGKDVEVHDGRKFNKVTITPDMIGHYIGEFAITRQRVKHGAAGIGATRSSKFIPLK